jgi:PadR family transcriptional regulator PadR
MATDETHEVTHEWPSDWLRGILTTAALSVLDRGAAHGYAIATALADAGLGTVKGGTLYPLLGRLEAAGHVEAEWLPGDGGPGRKVYSLTREGRQHLAEQAQRWAAFTATTTALLEGTTTESHTTGA